MCIWMCQCCNILSCILLCFCGIYTLLFETAPSHISNSLLQQKISDHNCSREGALNLPKNSLMRREAGIPASGKDKSQQERREYQECPCDWLDRLHSNYSVTWRRTEEYRMSPARSAVYSVSILIHSSAVESSCFITLIISRATSPWVHPQLVCGVFPWCTRVHTQPLSVRPVLWSTAWKSSEEVQQRYV